MYGKVLIATDGSELGRHAVDHGLGVAKALGASCVAVFVVDTRTLPGTHPMVPESMAPYYFSLIGELRKLGDTTLADVVEAGRQQGVAVTPAVVEGTPASAILEAAKKHGAGLIVMGTHGRSGLAAALLGSTAQAVVHRAEVPVLVVR